MSRQRRISATCCALTIAFLLSVCVSDAGAGLVSKKSLPELFEKNLKAVEKAIHFFGEDYSSLNVDGLFGIRICQGALLTTVKDCQTGRLDCPQDLVTTLTNFIDTMEDYGNKALGYIEVEDADYYVHFLDTINSPYTFNVSLGSIGDTSGLVPGSDNAYVENDGDRCFTLILGTHEFDNGSKAPRCSVNQECWTMMTKSDMKGYAITHQLLYFIMIEKAGCTGQLEELVYKYNKTSIHDLEKQFCKKIYAEAREEETAEGVSELRQDLFLEQMLLCGLVGFEEFFQEKWIRMVLGWQKARGCYGLPASLMKLEYELTRVQEDEKHLLQLLKEEAKKLDPDPTNPTRRKLLREKVMQGDCLAHKTGLAFGTLGLYLRYLITLMFRL